MPTPQHAHIREGAGSSIVKRCVATGNQYSRGDRVWAGYSGPNRGPGRGALEAMRVAAAAARSSSEHRPVAVTEIKSSETVIGPASR